MGHENFEGHNVRSWKHFQKFCWGMKRSTNSFNKLSANRNKPNQISFLQKWNKIFFSVSCGWISQVSWTHQGLSTPTLHNLHTVRVNIYCAAESYHQYNWGYACSMGAVWVGHYIIMAEDILYRWENHELLGKGGTPRRWIFMNEIMLFFQLDQLKTSGFWWVAKLIH